MTTPQTLGWKPSYDDRSRNYPLRAVLPSVTPVSKTWSCNYWLNQQNEGACVGFAWAHELGASPKPQQVDEPTARSIYLRAQQVDEWPGENYSGTSVLAGAKTCLEMNRLKTYRWGFSLNDLVLALSYRGPVVLGINWYESMFSPDPTTGIVQVSGDIAGGHAILARGVAVSRKYIRLRNSWGQDWGKGGDCLVKWSDMERLIGEGAEMCMATDA